MVNLMYGKIKRELKRQAEKKTPNNLNQILSDSGVDMSVSQPSIKTSFWNSHVPRKVVAVAVAVVLFAVSAFGSITFFPFWSDETSTEKNNGFGLLLVSAAEDGEPYTVSVSGNTTMELPVKGVLQLHDVSSFTDKERRDFSEETFRTMCEYLRLYSEESRSRRITSNYNENVLLRYGCINDFSINGIDCDRLSEIEITLDGIGDIELDRTSLGGEPEYASKHFVIPAKQYIEFYSNRNENEEGMCIFWNWSSELFEMLTEDPNFPLSSIKDIITFTVKYNDGTTDSFTVEISFEDSGEMHAVYSKTKQD